ncbi:MAG TPA: cyclopropane-fatty-acyl-phospholipid synthase family protein [Solirubrobacteraceae bacterium]|nr:cyclopropane-fatty-acyl-phospholipid synthase family protein [Solirubrobacteraceae bacterium]
MAERLLSGVAGGRLARPPVTVRFWDGSELRARADVPATVMLREPGALIHLLRAPGQLGLARAWVDGSLDIEGDLEAVLRTRKAFAGIGLSTTERVRIARAAVEALGTRLLHPPPIPAIEARLSGRRHWLARDRAAVRHHYDVSNRFYRLVLGPSMVYSCAYFANPDDTLEAAQARKLDLICRKLRVREGERFLDIGCGWGSLVMHAAAHYGARGLGVTLSEPQAELARERVAHAGLTERVEIRVQDYREIRDGPFDKIASVGMYEHVGRAELAHYARAVAQLLRPGGLFLNHGITRLVPHAPEPDPFISRYVFPDGELHPLADVVGVLQSAALEVRDVESLRDHYGLTLRRWVANLAAHREEAIGEVGSQRERVWRLYMLGSALGFEAGEISVHQVLAARPGAPHGLPLTRG